MVDPAATRLLSLAVAADREKRYIAAISLYTEGTQLLYDGIPGIADAKIKKQLKDKAVEYLNRAEELKKLVEAEKKKDGYHEQIVIEEGSVGHGLEQLFLPYIDTDLTEVEIDDSYIRANHQVQMFLRFCALLLKHARNIVTIHLTTTRDPNQENRQNQLARLDQIREGLLRRKVKLFVQYSDTLHDREIRFNNGYVIKIGRGLDYFKPAESPNSVDFIDLDFRQCKATTADIHYSSPKSKLR